MSPFGMCRVTSSSWGRVETMLASAGPCSAPVRVRCSREKTRQFIHMLKTLPIPIESPGTFDFLGSLTEIERFGRDHLLSSVTVRNLQLALEEMVLQTIVPHLDRRGTGYPIEIVIEYAEAEETVSLSLRYGGDPFDPTAREDNLSAMLIKGVASDVSYSYDGENSLFIAF